MTALSETSLPTVALIRPAEARDLDAIVGLLKTYARMGNLLPRTRQEITDNIGLFRVAEVDGSVIGCGALEIFTPALAEIRSLVVQETQKGTGTGRRLVERLIDDARTGGHKRLMALTYAPGFFHRLGFDTVPRDSLPEKVWGICVRCYKFNHCDEIAVLKYL